MDKFEYFTFAVTANFWKKFLYSARAGSQPRNSTDLSLNTWCINSTSELLRSLQKSSKNFLLLGWKMKVEKNAYISRMVCMRHSKYDST